MNTANLNSNNAISTFFAEQFANLTPWGVGLALAFALVVGLIIAFVYKRCYRGVLYSPNFAMTLIMMTLITTPVVMCIGSNIALSMGMVGALSIVRFRTAVKDPLDTTYMFWALTMGILLGAEQYIIALVVVAAISVILFVLNLFKFTNPSSYLLVVHYTDDVEQDIATTLRRSVKNFRLRAKVLTHRGGELTYEVQMENPQDLVNVIRDLPGVTDVSSVACQSEVGA